MSAKTVWKFEIPIGDVVTIQMPKGAEVLHVADQYGQPTMWALVDPGEPMVGREFRFAGTGHPVYEHHRGQFVGTFLLNQGSLVFHIFETLESCMRNDIPRKQRVSVPNPV